MSEQPGNHHRGSIRLKGYDYSQEGAYFTTICTKGRAPYFDLYPQLSRIVQSAWESLPALFPNVSLDVFVVMPNHVHGIIFVGATLAVAQERAGVSSFGKLRTGSAPTFGTIIGSFKSLATREWLAEIRNKDLDAVGSLWQRNYYEHVLRSEQELTLAREYIVNNPLTWAIDHENPEHAIDRVYTQEGDWLEGT